MRIQELTDVVATHDAAALFDRIWRAGAGAQVIDPSTLRAMSHTGNYVAGAYDGDTLVGAAVGFFAADGHLHSHITGVASGYQGRGIGRALKEHQRDWALAHGRTTITWTFDPLIARNAYFNLHTLGAVAEQYLPEFYGEMTDAVNLGDATDRLFVVWHLDVQPLPAPDASGIPARLDRDGAAPLATSRSGQQVTVATPPDIDRLRSEDPELAVRWRMALRDALVSSLAAGYRITGISRDGRYVLEART